jgi:hypothetical protein
VLVEVQIPAYTGTGGRHVIAAAECSFMRPSKAGSTPLAPTITTAVSRGVCDFSCATAQSSMREGAITT